MRFIKKAPFVSILLFLIQFKTVSQNSVGIASTLTISPTFSVLNTGTISISGSFINSGSISLTGTVAVNMAINTSTNSTPNYFFRNSVSYIVSSFAPLATNAFYISDVASGANQYKTNGNGTTVVVWPVFNGNSITTSDSAFTSIVVVLNDGITEIDLFESEILKITNPIFQNIEILYDDRKYKNVELVNLNGQIVQIIRDNRLHVSMLAKGLYYLNFYNSLTGKVVIKKVLIE